jgi:hypothetical protein
MAMLDMVMLLLGQFYREHLTGEVIPDTTKLHVLKKPAGLVP